jgi:FkbM family methyltransferase
VTAGYPVRSRSDRLNRLRIQQALVCSWLTTTPAAFARRELLARGELGTYTLKETGVGFCVHHGWDLGVLAEVFWHGWYDFPPLVREALRDVGRKLRVADLGAHVGLFGVHVLGHFPDAHITAFEPDPLNREGLSCCIAVNGRESEWQVVGACAATEDGSTPFASGLSLGSRRVTDGGAERVPTVDVFPSLQRADLIKMDIEGGEWEILEDPRFRSLRPVAIVLEYHDYLCPHENPRRAIEGLLRGMGWDIVPIWDRPGVAGMLWATGAR